MVKVDLTDGEIRLIHYIAGLATGKLAETEQGAKLLEREVFPLLEKLSKAQKE